METNFNFKSQICTAWEGIEPEYSHHPKMNEWVANRRII
jgi:hypothetical protein